MRGQGQSKRGSGRSMRSPDAIIDVQGSLREV